MKRGSNGLAAQMQRNKKKIKKTAKNVFDNLGRGVSRIVNPIQGSKIPNKKYKF